MHCCALSHQGSVANVTGKKNKEDESENLHSTLVLFSTDDEFTKKQDLCLCCGSFGRGAEGQLIVCSQCGQCYHPYCVGVKVGARNIAVIGVSFSNMACLAHWRPSVSCLKCTRMTLGETVIQPFANADGQDIKHCQDYTED